MVVGVGGTGSYLVNNLLNYVGSINEKSKIVLIDGDVVEPRNLMRQGFLQMDIGKNKAEALFNRFCKVSLQQVSLSYYPSFINSIQDISSIYQKEIEQEEVTDIVLLSCVDNTMARYRLIMSQYKLFDDTGKNVVFIDGGNTEWTGQALVNTLKADNESPVSFRNNKVTFTNKIKGHHLSTIFDLSDNWQNELSRGDHELSCEMITENSPQNIVANMSSANGMMYMLHMYNQEIVDKRYQFNASKGVKEVMGVQTNPNRLKEMVDYANGEGYKELFSVAINQNNEIQAELKTDEVEITSIDEEFEKIFEYDFEEIIEEKAEDETTVEIEEEDFFDSDDGFEDLDAGLEDLDEDDVEFLVLEDIDFDEDFEDLWEEG